MEKEYLTKTGKIRKRTPGMFQSVIQIWDGSDNFFSFFTKE